jgi:hypothetical protein
LEDGRLTYARNEVPVTEFLRTTEDLSAKPGVSVETFDIKGRGGQHKEIPENFADAILTGAELIAPAEEGIHSVEMANAMLYSSLTGGPVDLPLDGEAFERELKRLIENSTFVKAAEKEIKGNMGRASWRGDRNVSDGFRG